MRVGIVGAGPMGRLHAKTVSRAAERGEGCVLASVVDRHLGRAERLAAEFGARATSRLDDVTDELDAVIVAVPTASHAPLGRSLLDKGLDLLIEKPLATTVSEAEALCRLASERNVILQVGHVEWFNPAWREAAGLAGKARSILVERFNPPSRRGLDIDVVQDFMLHDLDWVMRYLGEEILELEARGRCVENEGYDEAEVRLVFRSGCRVRLRASRLHADRHRIVRIEGERGCATADLLARRLVTFEPRDGEPAASRRSAAAPDAGGRVDPLAAQWHDFLRACGSRSDPETDGRVGMMALGLVDRVRAAIADAKGRSPRDDDPALGR